MSKTNLFLTKEGELYLWAKARMFVSKADLMRYGYERFYLRAWRTVCDWASPLNPVPKARKLTPDECMFRGLGGKMAWYEIK